MAPVHRTPAFTRVLALALVFGLAAAPAHALRIVNYNILNYSGSGGAPRNPHFRTILGPLSADVVVVQEMIDQAGVNGFLANVLNTLEPGAWAAAPFINGNDTDNALFYRTSAVQFLGGWAWYPPDNLRLVNCYRLKPAGYTGAAAELRIYSQHLKASSGSTNEQRRLADAIGIRDSMNAMPPGTHAILLGDFNIYSGAEPAFQKFLESQPDNDGRLYDPLNAPYITWNTPSLSSIHTQSPCASGCPGSTGGLDDRFDMFLPTWNMNDGEGLDLVAGTYVPVGNDGLHYNLNITDSPTIPEGATYATALKSASDHLPVRVDFQVPSMLDAPASLALGTLIVGGSAGLAISNPAAVPADELDYALTTGGLFGTAAGPFSLAAGAPAATHPITATAGAAGLRFGSVTITCDAPDLPSKIVNLTAMVLDHAAPSLDSTTTLTAALADFGIRPPGGFEDQLVRVHNQGYTALQAGLSLEGANFTGGDGRFSIVGGFSPTPVTDVAASWNVHFDDAGAVPDTPYEATLTFASADEALPGATARPDLVVTLRAEVSGGAVSAPVAGLPAFTRLLAPFPNPLRGAATVNFDLAVPGEVRLEVFDLSGRRVTTLADGRFEAGRHGARWDGRDDGGGRAAPGLYFVRFSGPAGHVGTARLAVTER